MRKKRRKQVPKERREKNTREKKNRRVGKRHGQHSYMMKIITLKNTTCIQFSRFNLINQAQNNYVANIFPRLTKLYITKCIISVGHYACQFFTN